MLVFNNSITLTFSALPRTFKGEAIPLQSNMLSRKFFQGVAREKSLYWNLSQFVNFLSQKHGNLKNSFHFKSALNSCISDLQKGDNDTLPPFT